MEEIRNTLSTLTGLTKNPNSRTQMNDHILTELGQKMKAIVSTAKLIEKNAINNKVESTFTPNYAKQATPDSSLDYIARLEEENRLLREQMDKIAEENQLLKEQNEQLRSELKKKGRRQWHFLRQHSINAQK